MTEQRFIVKDGTMEKGYRLDWVCKTRKEAEAIITQEPEDVRRSMYIQETTVKTAKK